MKYIIKAIFRPVDNRYYTNKKVSAWLFALRYFPVVLMCVFGALAGDSFFWFVLVGTVVYLFIYYILFDGLLDKIIWKQQWERYYSSEVHESSPEHNVMKDFEKNPNEKNRRALQDHFKSK